MSEKERLRKIRDAQIAARDPGDSKIKGYDWKKHSKKHANRPKEKPLMVEMFYIMPTRWKGALIGLVGGGILGLILALLLTGEAQVLASLPPLVGFVAGMVLGMALQNDPVKR